MSRFDAFIFQALRGEQSPWPFAAGEEDAFVAHAAAQGVHVLLWSAARGEDWPDTVRERLKRGAMAAEFFEEQHRRRLGKALQALASAGVKALLFKGTALAYDVYPSPALRPRSDTDLIVHPGQRHAAARALREAGFTQRGSISCEFLSYEATFEMESPGMRHLLDLHWRLHYSQAQSALLPLAALLKRAKPISALGPALAPCDRDAVLLACMHRANDMRYPQWDGNASSYGSDRMIWIHDIHLLLSRMHAQAQEELLAHVIETGMPAVCAQPIALAVEHLHTPFPLPLLQRMQSFHRTDVLGRYHDTPAVLQRWQDFRTLGRGQRLRYLREHIAPPGDYMRQRYPDLTGRSLAALRLMRLAQGLRRLTPAAHGSHP